MTKNFTKKTRGVNLYKNLGYTVNSIKIKERENAKSLKNWISTFLLALQIIDANVE